MAIVTINCGLSARTAERIAQDLYASGQDFNIEMTVPCSDDQCRAVLADIDDKYAVQMITRT